MTQTTIDEQHDFYHADKTSIPLTSPCQLPHLRGLRIRRPISHLFPPQRIRISPRIIIPIPPDPTYNIPLPIDHRIFVKETPARRKHELLRPGQVRCEFLLQQREARQACLEGLVDGVGELAEISDAVLGDGDAEGGLGEEYLEAAV